jgi:hypothetical protein
MSVKFRGALVRCVDDGELVEEKCGNAQPSLSPTAVQGDAPKTNTLVEFPLYNDSEIGMDAKFVQEN